MKKHHFISPPSMNGSTSNPQLGPVHTTGMSGVARENPAREGGVRSRRVPWLQPGGGLLWTNHKFLLLGGSTSVINFTLQVDLGEDFFVRRNRSVNLAIKAIHISNAGLGDNNPGLNVTLQFSAGISWWK